MSTVSSPCVGVCTIDAPSGFCLGCGRSLDEIVAWGSFDEARRRGVMALLPGRLAMKRETALDVTRPDP